MIKTQLNTDRIAMTLSFACVIHCFFAPALIIFSYGLLSFSIESEIVHYFILFLAVPISSIALMIGYRNHNVLSFIIIGIVGLSVLILAVVLENFIEKNDGIFFIIYPLIQLGHIPKCLLSLYFCE